MRDHGRPQAMERSVTGPRAAVRALAAGVLAVGVLDGGFVVVRVFLNKGDISRPFQAIAAAILGAEAFAGGLATAFLGVALHFVVATGVVLTYYLASRHWGILTRRPVALGAIYGLAVYAMMHFVVIPLSALSPGPRVLSRMLPGILIHIVGVGIPTALAARAAAPRGDVVGETAAFLEAP
jgi:hypothetical protein